MNLVKYTPLILLVGCMSSRVDSPDELNPNSIISPTPVIEARISQYTELTSLADGDQFVVVDIDDTTMANSGTTKNITATNIASYVQSGRLENIVEDLTPQLGGTLDINSQTVTGDILPSADSTYDLGSNVAKFASGDIVDLTVHTTLDIPYASDPVSLSAGKFGIDSSITGLNPSLKYSDGASYYYVPAVTTLPTVDESVLTYDADTDIVRFVSPSGGGGQNFFMLPMNLFRVNSHAPIIPVGESAIDNGEPQSIGLDAPHFFAIEYSSGVDQSAAASFLLPPDYVDTPSVDLEFIGSNGVAGNVVINIYISALQDGDDYDESSPADMNRILAGTSTEAIVEQNAGEQYRNTSTISLSTLASASNNDTIFLIIERGGSDTNDTYGGTLFITQARFRYNNE